MEELVDANDAFDGTPATAEHIVPGYSYDKDKKDAWQLWVVIPTGVFSRLPINASTGWQVEEHEDGTISVTPSIWMQAGPQAWHGWLTRGEFVGA